VLTYRQYAPLRSSSKPRRNPNLPGGFAGFPEERRGEEKRREEIIIIIIIGRKGRKT